MKNIILGSLVLLAAVGCSSKKTVETSETKTRTSYKNERVENLPNGLKIYFVPDETLPQVSLQLLIPAGTVTEKPAEAGLNALTSQLLDQGTKAKKALELADLFADAGSEFEAQPGHDFTVLASSSLTTQFAPVLDLFVEVLTTPTFPQEDFDRIRQQMMVQIKSRKDRSGPWADFLTTQKFYQGTPYGRDIFGTEESLKKFTRQDVMKFYQAQYLPQGAILAVAGRFTPEMETAIRTKFANWKGTRANNKVQFQVTAPTTVGIVKVDTPHKAQTEIRFIQPGIGRAHPDYLKLRLSNEILGGSFASRLNQKVRDDLGLTYSIYSYLDTREQGGAWGVSTFSKNETAQKTIDETLGVLKQYAAEGATQKELDAAKNLVKAQFPRALETADKLAYNLIVLDFYGVGVQYLINFNKNIDSYSLKDINDTTKKYLNPTQTLILNFN